MTKSKKKNDPIENRIQAEDAAQVVSSAVWVVGGVVGAAFIHSLDHNNVIPTVISVAGGIAIGMVKLIADGGSVINREMTRRKAAKTNMARILATSLIPFAQYLPRRNDKKEAYYRYNPNRSPYHGM